MGYRFFLRQQSVWRYQTSTSLTKRKLNQNSTADALLMATPKANRLAAGCRTSTRGWSATADREYFY
jgi:hypothetical protein